MRKFTVLGRESYGFVEQNYGNIEFEGKRHLKSP
jgi:hypothetical protein